MFENIDEAPLGNILQPKQDKGRKSRALVKKLKKSGPPPSKKY